MTRTSHDALPTRSPSVKNGKAIGCCTADKQKDEESACQQKCLWMHHRAIAEYPRFELCGLFFSNSIWTAWAAKISDSGTDMPNTLNTARSVRVTPSSWEDVHLVDQEPAPLRSRILEILQVQLQLFTTTSTWYLPDWVPVTYLACWSHPGMTIIINVPIVAPRKPTTLATSLTFTNKKNACSSDSVADSNLAAKR